MLISQVYQLVKMGDEIHGALSGETALGVVPVAAEFIAVPLFVLLGNPDELLEVRALFVLLVVSRIDVVVTRKAH